MKNINLGSLAKVFGLIGLFTVVITFIVLLNAKNLFPEWFNGFGDFWSPIIFFLTIYAGVALLGIALVLYIVSWFMTPKVKNTPYNQPKAKLSPIVVVGSIIIGITVMGLGISYLAQNAKQRAADLSAANEAAEKETYIGLKNDLQKLTDQFKAVDTSVSWSFFSGCDTVRLNEFYPTKQCTVNVSADIAIKNSQTSQGIVNSYNQVLTDSAQNFVAVGRSRIKNNFPDSLDSSSEQAYSYTRGVPCTLAMSVKAGTNGAQKDLGIVFYCHGTTLGLYY